jgi:hypothetical protein
MPIRKEYNQFWIKSKSSTKQKNKYNIYEPEKGRKF